MGNNAQDIKRNELIIENDNLKDLCEELKEENEDYADQIMYLESELDIITGQRNKYKQILDLIGIKTTNLKNISLKKATLIKDKFEELNL